MMKRFWARLSWWHGAIWSWMLLGLGTLLLFLCPSQADELSAPVDPPKLSAPARSVSLRREKACCPEAGLAQAELPSPIGQPPGGKESSVSENSGGGPKDQAAEKGNPKRGWRPLFNGKDLEGWWPKIRGYPLGENYGQTFRVENGVLKVVYDPKYYPNFDNRFGHLFYKEKFSHYRLRVEYRFTGQQCPGGPGWAFRNSGIMIHCQDPKTMTLEQAFPVSIEVQLLGGRGSGERPTANLCTPGTHVVMDGKLFTPHCTYSRSKTYHGDQWVRVEVEVHGAGTVRHYVEGQLVLEYEKPQLDDRDPDAKRLLAAGLDRLLHDGYIALQSESHPVEFRKVEIMLLEESAKQ